MLETVPRKEDLNWRKVGKVQPTPAQAWHTRLSGAPGWLGVNWALSGKEKGDMATNHRTVRWCTKLSGESTAPAANIVRAINARHVVHANGRLGTPDNPVCTGQCPVCQRPRRTNGRLCPIWKEITHLTAIGAVRCTTRQKARIAYQIDLQRLLAALAHGAVHQAFSKHTKTSRLRLHTFDSLC